MKASLRTGALAAGLGAALLFAGAVVVMTQAARAADGFAWRLPPGVAPPPVPTDNPMSEAKVELGRRLFYDADLSLDGTLSCATCHDQRRAFTEGNATHPGVHDTPGRRNVMGLANVGYFSPLTWADPRQTALETQVLVPLAGQTPVEMGMAEQEPELVRRLGADPCYRALFAAAFPEARGAISQATVTKALAAFERTLLSFGSPYDRARRGDPAALPPAAKRGQALFFGSKFHCDACHAGPNFTDADPATGHRVANDAFHNVGLYDVDGKGAYPAADHGLRERTGAPSDEGKIRTPSLRNVALTGPYMHDGSVGDLALAILRHYGPGKNPLRDARLRGPAPDAIEADDLVAFLGALTDQGFITDPRFSAPKTACGKPL